MKTFNKNHKVICTCDITVTRGDGIISELVGKGTNGIVYYICDDGAIGVHWEHSWANFDKDSRDLKYMKDGHVIEVNPEFMMLVKQAKKQNISSYDEDQLKEDDRNQREDEYDKERF